MGRRFAEYLRTHAARVYAAGTMPATSGAASILKKIKAGKLDDNFSARDVYLKGWSHLPTPEGTHAALRLLMDLDYLCRIDRPTSVVGGRPTHVYRINPRIREA